MPILLPEDTQYPLPKLYPVEQHFSKERLEDVVATTREQLNALPPLFQPGQQVAVAVGSRGIQNLVPIVSTTLAWLEEQQVKPFLVSAMGSHGGGTQEGQQEVLANYGITAEALGVPVITTLDTVELGKTPSGTPVHFDAAALKADHIVVINRIKLHTDFVGDLQSGLCKMMVIGLGNHRGCTAIHEEDPDCFAQILEDAATLILNRAPIAFGIAIMENSYDQTQLVEAIPKDNIITREKELVKLALDSMPFLRLSQADVLICEEIGKDISGAGFDPNILGRSAVLKTFRLPLPKIQKMVLHDVTPSSHGNGIGVGFFDVITQKVADQLELEEMYANAIACKCIEDVKIPLTVADEDQALRVAIKTCRNVTPETVKIVRIKNTLELQYIQVSQSLLEEVAENPNLTRLSP